MAEQDVNTEIINQQRKLQQRLAEISEQVMSSCQRSGKVIGNVSSGDTTHPDCEEEEHSIEGPMTPGHKHILTRNRTTLVENIVPTDLFRKLVARNTLTSAEERRIRAKTTWEDINCELLDLIARRSDSAFTDLEEALRETCQEHLADLLLQKAGKRGHVEEVMTSENKHVIHRNRDKLAADITPDEIFNNLISEEILSPSEVSRIKEKWTREEKNESLLDYLVRRCDRAFTVFVQSLEDTGQEHLAKLLTTAVSQRLEQKRKKLKPLNMPVCDVSSENSPTPCTATPPTSQSRSCNSPASHTSETVIHKSSTAAIGQSIPANQQSSLSASHSSSSTQNTSHNAGSTLAFHENSLGDNILVASNQIPSLPQLSHDSLLPANQNSPTCQQGPCTLDDVKQQIMFMAENAYANIHRKDNSSEAFSQFSREMSQTTESINDSLKVFKMIKEFCEETDIDDEGQGQREESSGCHDNQNVSDTL